MPKNYILFCDNEEKLDKYNINVSQMKDQYKYEYHLKDLPHPYFGDVENAKVLFLAKNPSYSEFEDEYDTWSYEKENNNINLFNKEDDYYTALKNANLMESFDYSPNRFFFNSWKWWNKNVIGSKVKIVKNYDTKDIAFLNLCGYHSKSFLDTSDYKDNYNDFNSCELFNDIKFNNLELIIIVWGESIWLKNKQLGEIINKLRNQKKVIVLNEYYKDGEAKQGMNIRSIKKILDTEEDNEDKKILEDYFKVSKK